MTGVSTHGVPENLANGKWVPIFLNAVGEDQIRREGYLCMHAANGDLACKACGVYLPNSTPLQAHFKAHLRELDKYLAKRKRDNSEKRLAALAVARERRYTKAEQEVLDEFGL